MKVKYEYLKARCDQIKVTCEHSRTRCELLQEQIYAKLQRQTCKCNTSSINVQFDSASDAKTKAEYTGSKPLLELPTDVPLSTCALHTDEMCKICRMSRVRLISCKFHSKKKREKEPSRIPSRKVLKLFRKTRIIRLAAKSYLKKYIPSSSKLRLVLFEYNRCHFADQFARQKCSLSGSSKSFIKQSLYVTFVRLRTLKYKKSPLSCMCVDERMLKKLLSRLNLSYISKSHLSKWGC